jgi:hypothetical protein
MPTEGTHFHGIDGFKAFSSHHPSSEIGNASNTFMFCVFRAFRGPLFRNLGSWMKLKSISRVSKINLIRLGGGGKEVAASRSEGLKAGSMFP